MVRFLSALFLTATLLLCIPSAHAAETGLAYVVEVNGVISPATYDLIGRNLKRAVDRRADVVILKLDTPGGLYDSTQQIIQAILDSPVPVVTYVSPRGAHAASAGTYILYASHVAAMAPGTNLGAATPIQMGGKKAPEDSNAATLDKKMVNDAAAYIRSLAELRGRNAEWAERAVREAESLTSSEALTKRVIDLVAEDVPSLLNKLHGRQLDLPGKGPVKLNTRNAKVETVTPDWRHKVLDVITHPNVALLLMTLGFYGLIYEFAHPGVFLPGVVGGICLLLGLFALNVLPISTAGLALIFLGLALMAAEALTPTFGALGIGGAASFAFGATMLIDSDMPGYGVDPWLIAALTVSSLGLLSFLLAVAVRAQKKPKTTGVDELLASTGEVLSWSRGKGEVRVTGEVWQATAASGILLEKGDRVRILSVDGLRLTVAPQKH